ncbi:integrase [Gossypium australe]|uniref:Integrase n=1 Tax=Gossypium australe TaxID=47621 RepID=A0A5B6VCC0_9ROSI|nr:integrase [Gossypium australe]
MTPKELNLRQWRCLELLKDYNLLERDISILVELRAKPLFLQKIRELQFDNMNLLAKRKLIEDGQIAYFSIGTDYSLYSHN